MKNKNIHQFLFERKAAWIKANIKANLSEDEKSKIFEEAEEKFSLNKWLPDAAKRASQLSIVSHTSKFSHPNAKTSSIIAKNSQANDGYLRSGNVKYELDVLGNAAAMDVYKFLSLKMDDGRTVLEHLEADSEEIRFLFTIVNATYKKLKEGFLAIKNEEDSNKTNALVKQVYFPVEKNSYHLLSILTPAGLITKIKSQIDEIRFSEASKEARECRRENKFHEVGYDDIFNLTVTAYGGTKPQNISVLNNRNGGRAYLLSNIPPLKAKRDIALPKNNFFKDSLDRKQFKDAFGQLNKLIRNPSNNMHLRQNITDTIFLIAEQLIQYVFSIRKNEKGWSDRERFQSLPLSQRIWLDDVHLKQREEEEDWIDEVTNKFVRWIFNTYKYFFKVNLKGDAEFEYVREIIYAAVTKDKELLK